MASLTATYVLTIGLAFSVPLAPLAAMWVLAVNLIPQIGGFLGGSLFTLLAFTASATTGVICLILFLVWMNLENHVITPAIVGQAVDLSPPATMLAAIIGGAAAGVPGALVATPLVGAHQVPLPRAPLGQGPRGASPPVAVGPGEEAGGESARRGR